MALFVCHSLQPVAVCCCWTPAKLLSYCSTQTLSLWLIIRKQTHQQNTLINSAYTYTMKHPPRPLVQTLSEISIFNSSSTSILPLVFHPIWHSEDVAQFSLLNQSMLTRMVKCFLAQKKTKKNSSWGIGAKSQATMKLDGSAQSGTEIWGLVGWIKCVRFLF